MTVRPPRIPEHLLRRLLPKTDREYMLGDLEEQYATRYHETGRRAARRWYWAQLWLTVRPSRRERLSVAPDDAAPTSRKHRAVRADSIRQDIVLAWRQLRSSPGFAFTVILTLGLGIGSNTAIFSVVHGTLLRPLPYPEADELAYLTARLDGTGINAAHLSGPTFAAVRDRVPELELSAISETVVLPFTGGEGSETAVISRATWNFFDVLGVRPFLGRGFTGQEGLPLQPNEIRALPIVLSYEFWQDRLGSDESAVGRAVEVNGWDGYIVGVMPPKFEVYLPPVSNIGSKIDLWWPHRSDYALGQSDVLWARVIARRDRDVSHSSIQPKLAAVSAQLRAEDPYNREVGVDVVLTPLHDAVVGPVRGTLLVFLGAVMFVLLIACANVANLLLTRGAARRRELAVRSALGADRARIVRQIFTESALLSGLGIVAGVALSIAGVAVLRNLAPPDLPRLGEIGPHPIVLLFSVGLAVIATLIYGMVPAVQSSRTAPARALGERSVTASVSQRRIQSGLAVAQVALSIVLLTGAALMARSFRELQTFPLGFEPERLVTFRTNTVPACDRDATGTLTCDRMEVERDIEDRLRSIPGVTAVGSGFPLPMNGVYDRVALYTPDALRDDESARREAFFRTISPSYLPTMRIELLTGRGFEDADNDTSRAVVIVDEALAATEWPGENPVGKTVALFRWGFDRPEPYEVIGVTEFVPQWNHRDRRPTIYVPRQYYQSVEVSFAVRTSGDPDGTLGMVRQEMAAIDSDLPVEFVWMGDLVSRAMAPSRFVLTLLSVFSVMALTLACVGLYGVLAYGVRQRTREIGIRVAFGASGSRVVQSVVRHGATLAGLGVGIGLTGALVLSRLLEQHLFQVAPRDPIAIVVTASAVVLVTLGASWLPARRAARVDPMIALRMD